MIREKEEVMYGVARSTTNAKEFTLENASGQRFSSANFIAFASVTLSA
jgi:hypothetical protein